MVGKKVVGKKGNRIPLVTNQSPQGGTSSCADVNRPNRSESIPIEIFCFVNALWTIQKCR